MKKIIYFTLGLAAVFSFFSCDDEDFLTEKPKTIYTKDNAFEKASQVDAAVVTAYRYFQNLHLYNMTLFGGGVGGTFLHGDGSDVLGSTQPAASAMGSFNNYWALTSNSGNFSQLWNQLYTLASYANLALDGLAISSVTEAEAANLEGQAKFFRGWAYLRLGECYGGVPLVEKFTEELKFDYGRSTRKETYEFAIEDLETAEAMLPATAPAGRLTKSVAQHFLAEAYLAAGVETGDKNYYTKAIGKADAVISAHPIVTARFGARSKDDGTSRNGVASYRPDGNTFFDLFQLGNYQDPANKEAIMLVLIPTYEVYAASGGTTNRPQSGVVVGPPYRDLTWNTEIAAVDGTSGPWKGEVPKTYIGGVMDAYLGGCSWGIIGSSDYADVNIWEGDFATDDRNAQVNLCDPIVLDTRSMYFGQTITADMLLDPCRYSRISVKTSMQDYWGWDMKQHTAFGSSAFANQYGRDWYIARSAETYLLRAEAKLRNNDKAGAAADLNVIRARANATKMFDASEVDIYTILDERARELTWEEMRWPTLLRMGGNGQNEVMKHQLENYSIAANENPVFKGKPFPSWTLFPIPFNVRQLNSGAELEQNPGWD
ncbi:MAG: RagB/SusD family nutrient uptake outer membrane protein [Bacteroidales bacterium]|nr:RagB/SusD family nutrient uptake outer membrane protein [Bacteroidota bacterium]NLN99684.1 RagB/SusD family nutrient uptake outer membrane protein [Bacteroidales bacterium]